MKKHGMLLSALILALALGWTAGAYGADPAAKAPAAAGKAAPAAKPAEAPKTTPATPPKTEVPCEMTGKLTEKAAKNKQGKVYNLTVAQAKSDDGKAMDAMKGKTVRVTGKKGIDIASHVGKEVTIKGKLINNRRLSVETIK